MEPISVQASNSKLNLFKFTPKQLAVTFLSMALSIFIYAWFFGFWLSFLFMVLVLVHEMGHVFACRIKKMESSPPVFVPFLGAFITSPDLESDREKEAFVGFGGPFLGTLGALALFGLWIVLPSHPPVMLAASCLATFMNLFNFIPVRPLDGGRVAQIISDWSKYLGLVILVGFIMITVSPILWFVWVLFLSSIRMKIKLRIWFGFILEALMILHFFILWYLGAGVTFFWFACIIFVTWINLSRMRQYVAYKYMLKHKDKLTEETLKKVEAALAVPTKKELPRAPMGVRVKWFCYYVGFLIFTLFLMLIQLELIFPRI